MSYNYDAHHRTQPPPVVEFPHWPAQPHSFHSADQPWQQTYQFGVPLWEEPTLHSQPPVPNTQPWQQPPDPPDWQHNPQPQQPASTLTFWRVSTISNFDGQWPDPYYQWDEYQQRQPPYVLPQPHRQYPNPYGCPHPPPHSPYLAYGESTYQGSDPNNPDLMARSFSPAQLARVTAWFKENTADENITEENIDNTPTMVLSADVPNSITDVSINTAVGVDVRDEIKQSDGSQDETCEMLRDNKVLPRSALQVLPQNRMIGGQRLLDKDGVGQIPLKVLDISMAHKNMLRRYAK